MSEQAPSATGDAESASGYLDLVLEVSSDGEFFVISGGEFGGQPAATDQPLGEYVVEVRRGDNILYVEALVNPFLGHSFGGPEDEFRGHQSVEVKHGTVKAKIPGATLERIPEDVEVRLLRILDFGTVKRINSSTIHNLDRQNRIETVATINGESLRIALRTD